MVKQIDARNTVPLEDMSHRPLCLRGVPQEDFLRGVIPGLTRNPVVYRWLCIPFGQIPAYAGMTGLSMRYILTDYWP